MKSKSGMRKARHLQANELDVVIPGDYAWKVLGKLSEDLGYLLGESEQKQIRQIVRNRDYEAYLSLGSTWGPQCTSSHVGASSAEMHARYQIVTLLKKFRFPTSNAQRRQTALEKFRAAEAACGQFNSAGYKSLRWIEDERMCSAFTYAKNFLRKLLGDFPPDSSKLTHWSRHGPGANLDTKYGNTSLYFKYSEWPYSCTIGALRYARAAISSDERWIGALEDSYRERYNIPRHMILDQHVFWETVINVVESNRIAFVPKNSQTDRSIAIEPSLNLYLQLGVDGYIRRRLKRWGVDIDDQSKNREMARIGSRFWEDPDCFVTLDLAAASDSISTECCRAYLPDAWYDLLMDYRSPKGTIDGETISYEKISSMGNGFTFALETAIFTAIVYGVMMEFLGDYDPNRCSIYGDDLIVPKSIVGEVVSLLNLSGFAINHDKSFIEGPFRESCGADWFRGIPVRPVFLTTNPTTVMELWTDLNRLRRILSLRFMVYDSAVERLLTRWIPEKFLEITGPVSDEQFDSYRHVSLPTGKYVHWYWKYRTLAIRPKPVRGPSFLFRKLMHDLRADEIEQPKYKSYKDEYRGCKITGTGSRFTVTRPFLVTVGYSHSVASEWRSEYKESQALYYSPL